MKMLSLSASAALMVLSVGCSTHQYALRPIPGLSPIVTHGEMDFIEDFGTSADVCAYANVLSFQNSEFLAATVIVSNRSNAKLEFSYTAMRMTSGSGRATRTLAPIEPETLVEDLAKRRASHESSRNWGTFFLALAAAHHNSGESVDAAKVGATVESRNAVTGFGSQQAADRIRSIDRALLRTQSVDPASDAWGLVVFPFVKSDSYRLRATVAGEMHEFVFRLRSY